VLPEASTVPPAEQSAIIHRAGDAHMFGARDTAHLMSHLGEVMRDDTFKSHVEELAPLWHVQTSFSSHTLNYTLTGERHDPSRSRKSRDRVMIESAQP
jgi:hypothetical protein